MSEARAASAHAFVNPAAAAKAEPCGNGRESDLSAAGFAAARADISSWPGYLPTPLVGLPGLARELGCAQLLYKDESGRFEIGRAHV